jgi:UDP-glucose 4-epimerase
MKNGYYITGKVLRDNRESFAMKKDIGKIVVTGGSGFIGTAFALSLPRENLVILDVKPPIDELKENWVYADIMDSYSVYEACKDAQFIYHFAANPVPSIANKNPAYDLRLNVIGTLNVINAALKNNSRILFTSTGLIDRDGNYAVSKRACELYIKSYVKRCGLDAVIVRLENVYGPTQKLGYVIPDFIHRMRVLCAIDDVATTEFKIRGTGNDVREFVYVDDVIDALQKVMRKGEKGEIYPIGSGEVVTIKELGWRIRNLMGSKAKVTTEKEEAEIDVDRTPADVEKTKGLGWVAAHNLNLGLKLCIGNE